MRSRKSKRAFIKQKSVAIFWIALSILFIWSRAFAAVPINGEALPGLDSFDKAMIKFIEKHNIPGGSLAVSFKGKLILAKGYGYADFSVFKKVPAHPRNRFRFASLSKPLTASAIMSLVEEGRLSLDSKVVPLLQGDPPHKIRDKRLEQITIQHLLEHRGGYDRQISSDPMFAAQPPCPGNLSSYFRERLDFTPGEKYAYSNLGYCLLGRVIERISGKPYEVFIKERILQPVGANSLEIGDSKETKPDEVSYFQDPSETKQSPIWRFRYEGPGFLRGMDWKLGGLPEIPDFPGRPAETGPFKTRNVQDNACHARRPYQSGQAHVLRQGFSRAEGIRWRVELLAYRQPGRHFEPCGQGFERVRLGCFCSIADPRIGEKCALKWTGNCGKHPGK